MMGDGESEREDRCSDGARAHAAYGDDTVAASHGFLICGVVMFTGIIERVCKIAGIRSGTAAVRLDVELGDLLDGLPDGASVAVNGVCLTLAQRQGAIGGFDVVPETWRVTNLGALQPGTDVNVERSLRVGDRLDGHFVQGHVDGVGVIERIDRAAGEYKIWTAAPHDLAPYLVRKGSIAIDGTSLTIVDAEPRRFSVAVIPTTLERTVLRLRRPGDRVNLETDILARLAVGRLEQWARRDASAPSGLTAERLRESGFMP